MVPWSLRSCAWARSQFAQRFILIALTGIYARSQPRFLRTSSPANWHDSVLKVSLQGTYHLRCVVYTIIVPLLLLWLINRNNLCFHMYNSHYHIVFIAICFRQSNRDTVIVIGGAFLGFSWAVYLIWSTSWLIVHHHGRGQHRDAMKFLILHAWFLCSIHALSR